MRGFLSLCRYPEFPHIFRVCKAIALRTIYPNHLFYLLLHRSFSFSLSRSLFTLIPLFSHCSALSIISLISQERRLSPLAIFFPPLFHGVHYLPSFNRSKSSPLSQYRQSVIRSKLRSFSCSLAWISLHAPSLFLERHCDLCGVRNTARPRRWIALMVGILDYV